METEINCSKWLAPQRPYMYVSQTLARWNHSYSETGHKHAQDPPGSLHTILSSVEWSSLKGRGPRWFTIRKVTCFTKTPHTYIYVCITYSLWKCEFTRNQKRVVNRLKIPQGLSTLLFHRWSEVPSRGGVRSDSLSEKLPASQRRHIHIIMSVAPTASGRVNSLVIGNGS